MLQMDFNFRGTFERALESNFTKALKTLVSFFFDEIDTQDYYHLIMNDLELLLESDQISINEFFQVSEKEALEKDKIFCNIEIPMKQLELPIFSDQPAEYIKVNDFECFHNFEQEITDQILERDKAKNPETP